MKSYQSYLTIIIILICIIFGLSPLFNIFGINIPDINIENVNAFFSYGDGTKENPFGISNIYHLQNIDDYLNSHFELTTDIDASDTKDWNSGKGFKPIGFPYDNFYGTIEGNGHKISNLYINRPDEERIGLFKGILHPAFVRDLILDQIDITGKNKVAGLVFVIQGDVRPNSHIIDNCHVSGKITSYGSYAGGFSASIRNAIITNSSSNCHIESSGDLVGGFSGFLDSSVEVWNCSSSGSILSTNTILDVGGFAGKSTGSIINSFADVDIDVSGSQVGGLVGSNLYLGNPNGGEIINSFSRSKINVRGNATGGFLGRNSGVIVKGCYSIADINCSGERTGGFVGINYAYVAESFSKGSVMGNGIVGGFAGENIRESAIIEDCYSNNRVTGNVTIGGFVGENNMYRFDEGIIRRCYTNSSLFGGEENGSFACNNNGKIFDSFFDNEISSYPSISSGNTSGVYGNSTHNLTHERIYKNKNWNFTHTWGILENHSYPYLQWEILGKVEIVGKFPNQLFEDHPINFTFNTKNHFEGQPDTLIWNLVSNANWLRINFLNGNIYGIPRNEHVGQYWVNVSLNGYKILSDHFNFTLNVINTNDPPIILDNVENITMFEDTNYFGLNLTQYFIDIDDDALFYSYLESEHILVEIFENNSVKLSPVLNWNGHENITFYTSDMEYSIPLNVSILVLPVNDRPINNNFSRMISKTDMNNLTFTAHDGLDVDGDLIFYDWYINDTYYSRGEILDHVFERSNISKEYVVSLVVTDGSLKSDICSHRVIIDGIPDNIPIDDDDDDDDNVTNKKEKDFSIFIFILIFLILFTIICIVLFIRWRKNHTGEGQIAEDDKDDPGKLSEKFLSEQQDLYGDLSSLSSEPRIPHGLGEIFED